MFTHEVLKFESTAYRTLNKPRGSLPRGYFEFSTVRATPAAILTTFLECQLYIEEGKENAYFKAD